MTVAELREKLKQFPDDMEVVTFESNDTVGGGHYPNPSLKVDDLEWARPGLERVLVIRGDWREREVRSKNADFLPYLA